MVDTTRQAASASASVFTGSDGVLQTGFGDVGAMFLAVVLLVVFGLGAVALWRGGVSGLFGDTAATADSRAQPTSETEQEPEPDQAQAETEAVSEPAAESTAEEVTDRERVLGILDDNEGRMKQARIVDETDWSKSKVSMVLSEMEENGDISKLRVGRENIISLAGSEPEAAGSPFDDE